MLFRDEGSAFDIAAVAHLGRARVALQQVGLWSCTAGVKAGDQNEKQYAPGCKPMGAAAPSKKGRHGSARLRSAAAQIHWALSPESDAAASISDSISRTGCNSEGG